MQILEELHRHIQKHLVLANACLEPGVHFDQLVDYLLFLAVCVALKREHLRCFKMALNVVLRFL